MVEELNSVIVNHTILQLKQYLKILQLFVFQVFYSDHVYLDASHDSPPHPSIAISYIVLLKCSLF